MDIEFLWLMIFYNTKNTKDVYKIKTLTFSWEKIIKSIHYKGMTLRKAFRTHLNGYS